MKRLLLALLLLLPVVAHASTTTLTGTIRDAAGNGINGVLELNLAVSATDLDANVLVSNAPVRFRLVNGAIVGPATVNDVGATHMQPAGNYYKATVYDSAGNPVMQGNFVITGATFNMGTAVPTNVTTSNVSYSGIGFLGVANTWTASNTWTGNNTFANLDKFQFADGVLNTTICAAIALLPSGGGEVWVPSLSSATWGSCTSVPANVTVRFASAAASYAIPGPITLGSQSHIICSAGQSAGLSGQNNPTFPNAGTILNFTGNLTSTQDAISASGNNSNDGVSIEGCYIKLGGSGRDGIHFSGINSSLVARTVIADPGRDGYRLDGGTVTLSHSYDNQLFQVDVIHAAAVGYHLTTVSTGGDVDRTTFINASYHPRDVNGSVSSGTAGFLLEVTSGSTSSNAVSDTAFVNCLVNGTASGSPAVEFLVSQSGLTQAITGVLWLGGQIEEVYTVPNPGTGLFVSNTAASDLQKGLFVGGLGLGFTTDTNITPQNAQGFVFMGAGVATGNRPNYTDFLTFQNSSSATPALANGGLRFKTATGGNYILTPTSDGIIHYFRDDTAVDQFGIDSGNKRIRPAADNNGWTLGQASNRWTDVQTVNIGTATFALAVNLLMSSTAPTISSGFGTTPSIATNNGTASFTVNVGTGGTATSGVIGLPAAVNGWNVSCTDITTTSATVFITKQTATTTTTATIGNFNTSAAAAAWAASDILSCTAFAR